jgi:hypothetical protein
VPLVRILARPNHTMQRHVHPDGSVRLERVAVVTFVSMLASQSKAQVGTHLFYYYLVHVNNVIHIPK